MTWTRLCPCGTTYNVDTNTEECPHGPKPPERGGREGDSQALPTAYDSDKAKIHELVQRDLQARMELGIRRYGTPLQAHNGRSALRDAYEESLDLAVYLRQALEEQEGG